MGIGTGFNPMMNMVKAKVQINKDYEKKYGFRDPEKYTARTDKGLSKEIILEMCKIKNEPKWMLDIRLKALEIFQNKPMPKWGPKLNLNFEEITYYIKPSDKVGHTWEEVPEGIRKTFERLGIPEAERKFLGGVGAQYECLSGDSIVFTQNRGPQKIKDIKSEDIVYSLDESVNKLIESKVKCLEYKGKKPVYELKIGTRKIKATSNHPFLVLQHDKKIGARRGRYKRVWKYLNEIKVGDLIAVVKDVPIKGKSYSLIPIQPTNRDKKINLPNITSEDLMWFLGLYLGDGCIHKEKSKRKCRVEISIPSTDTQLRNVLSKVILKLFGYEAKISDSSRVSINSTILAHWIESIGFGGKALTKRIPEWLFSLPKNEILAFLGGYVDADGYVRDANKNHDISITSANEKLLQDVKYLCTYMGISASAIHKFRSWHPFDTKRIMIGFRLQLSGNFDLVKCRSVHRISRMNKRKYLHNNSCCGNSTFRDHITDEIGFAKVQEIKLLGIESVYDIEVNGPHNFISEGIIVHNSESVYHNLREDLATKGVIFEDMSEAIKKYPDLVKEHFGKVVPMGDNKFASLNTAVWSGGTFIYIPKGVKVTVPLQAYFRINAQNVGQFERTLIIVDEGAEVSYLEGCTAPTYSTNSLHAAVVEVIAKKGAKIRYTTIQNWSNNVYNLVTKRAFAYENAIVEWVDGNLGSAITMKYPAVYLMGKNAKADILTVAYAGKGQNQDTGAKIIHLAPETNSRVISKSLSKDGGRSSYRGIIRIGKGAVKSSSSVKCDALILDDKSHSDTYPTIQIQEEDSTCSHEAYVGRIGEEQLFYMMSRGLSEQEAMAMIVLGFIAEFTKELPMEYAIELNKLIRMEMEGSVG